MYIGLAIVAFPYTIHWVGIVLATAGLVLVCLISLSSSYFLFKARNRFKTQVIIDLPDLGYACYGAKVRVFCQVVLISCQVSLLTAYLLYLGEQTKIIAT